MSDIKYSWHFLIFDQFAWKRIAPTWPVNPKRSTGAPPCVVMRRKRVIHEGRRRYHNASGRKYGKGSYRSQSHSCYCKCLIPHRTSRLAQLKTSLFLRSSSLYYNIYGLIFVIFFIISSDFWNNHFTILKKNVVFPVRDKYIFFTYWIFM